MKHNTDWEAMHDSEWDFGDQSYPIVISNIGIKSGQPILKVLQTFCPTVVDVVQDAVARQLPDCGFFITFVFQSDPLDSKFHSPSSTKIGLRSAAESP